jgi:hypothetical protein
VQQSTGARHREERGRVDQERNPGPSGGGEQAAEQRAGGHAQIARGLDVPVGLGDAVLAGGGGDQRELRRRAEGDGRAEEHAEREHHRQ